MLKSNRRFTRLILHIASDTTAQKLLEQGVKKSCHPAPLSQWNKISIKGAWLASSVSMLYSRQGWPERESPQHHLSRAVFEYEVKEESRDTRQIIEKLAKQRCSRSQVLGCTEIALPIQGCAQQHTMCSADTTAIHAEAAVSLATSD